MLDYLARYVHRIAITNGRFLQHVLPKGFHKIRYYGLWHCAKRPQRENARRALLLKQAQPALELRNANSPSVEIASDDIAGVTCPYCGSHHAKLLGPLPPGLAPHAARASPADPF